MLDVVFINNNNGGATSDSDITNSNDVTVFEMNEIIYFQLYRMCNFFMAQSINTHKYQKH